VESEVSVSRISFASFVFVQLEVSVSRMFFFFVEAKLVAFFFMFFLHVARHMWLVHNVGNVACDCVYGRSSHPFRFLPVGGSRRAAVV